MAIKEKVKEIPKKLVQREFRSSRVNEMMAQGWKVVKVRNDSNQIGVGDLTLMEKEI